MKNKQGSVSSLNLIIHDSASKFYKRELKPVESDLYTQVVNLLPLSENSIKQVLIDLSEPYLKQVHEEIENMVGSQEDVPKTVI